MVLSRSQQGGVGRGMLETKDNFEHRGQVETHSQRAEWKSVDRKKTEEETFGEEGPDGTDLTGFLLKEAKWPHSFEEKPRQI